MTSEETPPAKTRNQRAHGQLTAFHFEQLTLVEKQLNVEAKEKKSEAQDHCVGSFSFLGRPLLPSFLRLLSAFFFHGFACSSLLTT